MTPFFLEITFHDHTAWIRGDLIATITADGSGSHLYLQGVARGMFADEPPEKLIDRVTKASRL